MHLETDYSEFPIIIFVACIMVYILESLMCIKFVFGWPQDNLPYKCTLVISAIVGWQKAYT